MPHALFLAPVGLLAWSARHSGSLRPSQSWQLVWQPVGAQEHLWVVQIGRPRAQLSGARSGTDTLSVRGPRIQCR
jgi:hypothetical protein